MKLQIRTNPRLEDGWIRRSAIALLVGLGASVLALPIAFLLFLSHFQSAYPKDTQNFLSALTAAVGICLLVFGLASAATMLLYLLLGLRGRPYPE